LGRQSQFRQQFSDRCDAQIDVKSLSNQLAHYQTCPKAKIKTMLPRVLAVDPMKKLPFLFAS